MKNIKLNKWYDYQYLLGNKILLSAHIESAVKNFWIDVIDNLKDGLYIKIQFKILKSNGEYKSISYLQTANKGDLNRITKLFKEYWDIKDDSYLNDSVEAIVFTYKVMAGTAASSLIRHKKSIQLNKEPFKFGGVNLPKTMDVTNWSGNVVFSDNYSKAIVYINKSEREYHVSLFENYQEVKVMLGKDLMFEFTDTVNDVYNLSSFTRKINKQSYIFLNGELIVKQIDRKANFLTTIEKNESISSKFITMDLETRTINGKMIPYCVSTFQIEDDGHERGIYFYLNEYKTPDEMLKNALETVLSVDNDGYKVYLHNFSNFDAVFLLRVLSEMEHRVRPIIRDGRIIDVKVDFAVSKYCKCTIHFRDSYQILNASLSSLAKNFNVENKGIFPYAFVNKPDVPLDYWGPVPEFKYFDGITIDQYNDYCKTKKYWDLKNETAFYCNLDCKVLYKVISIFSNQIFELFKLDIHSFPTLPSLALAIYRSNFLKDSYKIPLIDGSVYTDIKKGYTGGMVDVYKPTNTDGKPVFSYDVNSLYPKSMRDFPVPTGTPNFFDGDITKINPNAYGIFEVEVEAPINIYYPVLQTRVNTGHGIRTIAPVGEWSGWYFSAEIYNAMKFGYRFKVLRGYIFDKGYVFTDYVNFLYNLKANSDRGTPNYVISKLLLNSLYGKFGTDPDNEMHTIIDSDKLDEFNTKNVITEVTDLCNGKTLLSYYKYSSNKMENNKPSSKNTSVPLAMAITAYARIHMSILKKAATDQNLIIYYMDTDCLALSGELDPKFIGTDLGLLKLEHVFNEVVYLAPKVYAGKADNYQYSRAKGVKNYLNLSEIKPLLIKGENLKINQDKWYKNIGEGFITVKDEVYTLMLTENKRELIFNDNNVFVDTKPYIIKNGTIINSIIDTVNIETNNMKK